MKVPTVERINALHKESRLSWLYLPYGDKWGDNKEPLICCLSELWQLVKNTDNTLEDVDLDKIKSIYIFGSSVKGPNTKIRSHKFLCFEWETKTEDLVRDVDILVLTVATSFAYKTPPELGTTYSGGEGLEKNGYHVVHHPFDQIDNDAMINRIRNHAVLLAGENLLGTTKHAIWNLGVDDKAYCRIFK